ncbi:MAG: hypothetical protein H7222_16500 [Methylotenera sp.]|nr:hypothetical protein [Oligoflexia bacterium]
MLSHFCATAYAAGPLLPPIEFLYELNHKSSAAGAFCPRDGEKPTFEQKYYQEAKNCYQAVCPMDGSTYQNELDRIQKTDLRTMGEKDPSVKKAAEVIQKAGATIQAESLLRYRKLITNAYRSDSSKQKACLQQVTEKLKDYSGDTVETCLSYLKTARLLEVSDEERTLFLKRIQGLDQKLIASLGIKDLESQKALASRGDQLLNDLPTITVETWLEENEEDLVMTSPKQSSSVDQAEVSRLCESGDPFDALALTGQINPSNHFDPFEKMKDACHVFRNLAQPYDGAERSESSNVLPVIHISPFTVRSGELGKFVWAHEYTHVLSWTLENSPHGRYPASAVAQFASMKRCITENLGLSRDTHSWLHNTDADYYLEETLADINAALALGEPQKKSSFLCQLVDSDRADFKTLMEKSASNPFTNSMLRTRSTHQILGPITGSEVHLPDLIRVAFAQMITQGSQMNAECRKYLDDAGIKSTREGVLSCIK